MANEVVVGETVLGGGAGPAQLANARLLEQAALRMSAVLLAAYGDETVKPVLTKVGIRITNRVKQLSHQHGTGRTYVRRGIQHQASAPGQPFATDTGRLSASYNWQVGEDNDGAFLDVGTNVEYGPYLEFGTSRMAPRPTLRPAIELERDKIATENRDAIALRMAELVHGMGGH